MSDEVTLEETPKSRPQMVSDLVTGRVEMLQREFLRGDSRARGMLAVLRKAYARQPGETPSVWEITSVPADRDRRSDLPSRAEEATHRAITMYALHQQSQAHPMHQRKVGLGHAIYKLSVARDSDVDTGPVRQRFNALVTSATARELSFHLRSLVGMLRSAGIAVDYGQLARDIYSFSKGGSSAASVRLRWSRQYASPYSSSDKEIQQ